MRHELPSTAAAAITVKKQYYMQIKAKAGIYKRSQFAETWYSHVDSTAIERYTSGHVTSAACISAEETRS